MAQTARIPLEARTGRVTFADQEQPAISAGMDAYCNWSEIAWPSPHRTEIKPLISSKLAERYFVHIPVSGVTCDYPTLVSGVDWRNLNAIWGGQDYATSLAKSAAMLVQVLEEQKQVLLEQEFNELASQWYNETAMISLIRQKALHPCYQAIIGMGKEALPFIFREMSKGKGDWMWALKYIVRLKETIVPKNSTHKEAVAIWLQWGKDNDYFKPQWPQKY